MCMSILFDVPFQPKSSKAILSLLDNSQLHAILAGITVEVNRRLPKRIFVYNPTQTILLHISDTVTAFMLLSGLSGAAIRKLCLSPTGVILISLAMNLLVLLTTA